MVKVWKVSTREKRRTNFVQNQRRDIIVIEFDYGGLLEPI